MGVRPCPPRYPRCPRCGLHDVLCLCPTVTPLTLAPRIVVLMHHTEQRRTTNTAHLLPLCLTDAEIRLRGLPGERNRSEECRDESRTRPQRPTEPYFGTATEEARTKAGKHPAEPLLNEDLAIEGAGLLWPSPEATILGPEHRLSLLVVPDGNWRQARKVATRERALAGLPHYTLPPGPPSRYRLRSHPEAAFLSTFEAVARALTCLHGPQPELERVFDTFVERILWTRGKLAAEAVIGGIPEEARLKLTTFGHERDEEDDEL